MMKRMIRSSTSRPLLDKCRYKKDFFEVNKKKIEFNETSSCVSTHWTGYRHFFIACKHQWMMYQFFWFDPTMYSMKKGDPVLIKCEGEKIQHVVKSNMFDLLLIDGTHQFHLWKETKLDGIELERVIKLWNWLIIWETHPFSIYSWRFDNNVVFIRREQ